MAEQHLTKEQVKLLSNRRLRGEELLTALEHVENCGQCRSQIKLPAPEEILKRIEPDAKPATESSSAPFKK